MKIQQLLIVLIIVVLTIAYKCSIRVYEGLVLHRVESRMYARIKPASGREAVKIGLKNLVGLGICVGSIVWIIRYRATLDED